MDIVLFLSLEQILAIHSDQVDRYGGSHGIRDIALLESAVFRPQSSFGGMDLYPSVFGKAAALIHSIIHNHPFLDGNKRTGIVSGIVFLEINNYSLRVSQKDLVGTAIAIATNKMDLEEIASWFKRHSEKKR